ncbi:hypothetical protein OH764_00830 [Burkholderia sp. M6-3]
MAEEEQIEANEKCPLMQAKRARQKHDRELVESGQRTLESMFLISPEIVRTFVLTRRTDDF